jgi:hypothetical protein
MANDLKLREAALALGLVRGGLVWRPQERPRKGLRGFGIWLLGLATTDGSSAFY